VALKSSAPSADKAEGAQPPLVVDPLAGMRGWGDRATPGPSRRHATNLTAFERATG
jgi:hypothetical protein